MNNSESKEDKINILKILKEKWSNSLSHGIPNIARTNFFSIKLFWIVILLGSSSMFAYLVLQSIFEYFRYDVNSKIRLINEFPIKFPGISICNKDTFITDELIEILADLVQNNSNRFDLRNFDGNLTNKFEVLNYLILNDDDNDGIQRFAFNNLILRFNDLKNKMIPGLNERIIKCEFNMKDCSNLITYDFDEVTGLCFNFNTIKPYYDLRNVGDYFGFEFILIVGKSDKYSSLASSYGSVVYIYNQSFSPSKLNSIDVSTETETKIAFSRSFNVKQKYPYSDCVISSTDDPKTIKSDYVKDIIQRNLIYTQVVCLIDGIQNNYFNTCNCFNTNLDCYTCDNKTMCNTNEELSCLKSMNISDEMNEKCQGKCPVECETQSMSFKITTSSYPTETEKHRLLKSSPILRDFMDNNEEIENKILKIKIFTETFFYQHVSESPSVTIPNLLASFGGNLGLCLGISILTVFEIIEICIELFFYFIEKRNIKVTDLSKK